ncbi:MAG: hypothetical protein UT14_C0041G0002 [Candidatus Shapirobacteria bacterium GW2011_GWE1_38_92]|nr:MAG: hypothetical protein UT14_C0041G0002 [Candidatus Shapirobacteria bacterium GW2011_GWE1_38_92]HAP37700.1 transposase [Candidatus Shapirobacteria bacterium]
MYFVTIDIENKKRILGEVKNGIMELSEIGMMVEKVIIGFPNYFLLELGKFIVMPDHIHLIIGMGWDGVGADFNIRPGIGMGREWNPARTAISLGELVGRFKIFSTNQYIKGVKEKNWPRFDKRLWQRNYYERIIRNKSDLLRVERYIMENPVNFGKIKDV